MPRESDLATLAVLADGQRRRVFEQLQSAGSATVSELAEALGIGRTLVTFHLAKLVEAGLVEAVAAQRRPGARGRPSQTYRLTGREVAASVPERRYDLLAGVLLDGIAGHRSGETAQSSAGRAARRRGRELGERARGSRAARTVAARLERLEVLLSSLGYLPRREDRTVTVQNCPFDRFRAERTDQVCGLNLELSRGYVEGLGIEDEVDVALRPCPDSCCVVFSG